MNGIKIKFVSPKFKINTSLNEKKILKHLEKCGRRCYQSDGKITEDSCYKFVSNLITRGHESVLEHFSFSVTFTCSRAISHQLVRHRISSFSEQSQRYCNYTSKVQLQVIIPHWISEKDKEVLAKAGTIIVSLPNYDQDEYDYIYFPNVSEETLIWADSIGHSVEAYRELIQAGFKPEEARSVLPNSVKTEITMTANIREWRHMLKLRTSPAADSEMRGLMIPFLKQLKEILPTLFSDIEVNKNEAK